MSVSFPAMNEREIEHSREDRMWVIHPYYSGRDKGAVFARKEPTPESPGNIGPLLVFRKAGHAWWYIFNKLQPNDQRAMDNYRVITLKQYHEGE